MNIEKHAKASTTVIDLSIKDNWLTLTIGDNGVGFNKDAVAKPNESGIGTRNLAERVQYHRGKFKVVSTSKGTTVVAKIPRSAFANYYVSSKEASMQKELT